MKVACKETFTRYIIAKNLIGTRNLSKLASSIWARIAIRVVLKGSFAVCLFNLFGTRVRLFNLDLRRVHVAAQSFIPGQE